MMKRQNSINLKEIVDSFVFSLKADGRSHSTCRYYSQPLKHFLKYAKAEDWPEQVHFIDSMMIRQFLSWVGSRSYEYIPGNGSRRCVIPGPSTAWSYYKALRRLFNWAIEEGLIKESPLKSIHYKAPAPALVQPYTKDEIVRLIAVCDFDIRTGSRFVGLRNKVMLLLFIDSAIRLKEMAGLYLGDVNINDKIVRIIGKGGKEDICPFSNKTRKILIQYMFERKSRAKTDALWVTEEGNPFTVNGLSSWFDRLKKRANISGPGRIHRLRHTSALQYLRNTRNTFYLQLFLRHKDLSMSRRYTQGLTREEAIEAHQNGGSPVESLGLD